MTFAIVIMSRARRQIVGQSAWWRQNRPAAPSMLDDELERAFVRLIAQPELGTVAPWPRFAEVRRLLVVRAEYILFYRVRPKARRIEVLAFWPARRGSGPPTR